MSDTATAPVVYRYYVVYSTPTGWGSAYISRPDPISTFDDVTGLTEYVKELSNQPNILLQNWILLSTESAA